MIVIHDFGNGVAGVHARDPVRVSVTTDAGRPGEALLAVDFPESTGDPAARDVWLNAMNRDWRAGRAISFEACPSWALRISVSFLDRNKVAYTSWADLGAGKWQNVTIPFDGIRPNPYFQPPGAPKDAPLDVSDVARLGFAPQTPGAGRLLVGQFVVVSG